MISILFARLATSLRRSPSKADASGLLVELAWLLPILGVAVVASPAMEWSPQFGSDTFKLALVAIFVPALGEELLFRVVPLPDPQRASGFPWFAASIALTAFVLWHPLQALLFGGARAEIFLDLWFLIAVAALGFACTRLYWKSGSVWPAVFLHWLVVVGWKALAGGPPLV